MSGDRCKTKYPLLLAHGLNSRDHWPMEYWGRVPEALEAEGARVYLGGQDAWGSVEDNAAQLREVLLRALEETGAEKVNIIGHSKGGLEARYLISTMGMGEYVASLTTVCTPHHGTGIADKFLDHPWLITLLGGVMKGFWRLTGDKAPDPWQVAKDLSRAHSVQFNRDNPDDPKVYYQSWGADLRDHREDVRMMLIGKFMRLTDGATDGLVNPKSARWTNYRGDIIGVSHEDMTDTRKVDLEHFDVREFYIRLAEELKNMGF